MLLKHMTSICNRPKILQSSYLLCHIRRCSTLTNQEEVRVRFAPSPTGYLHLGGLRSALYNHLFARSNNGKFILRIEDTDQERLVPGAMDKMCDILDWAGIQVDEGPRQGGQLGPYIQSERKHIYQDLIQELLKNGTAYPCFCSVKRLELLHREALKLRETPKYDNKCRDLSKAEVEEKIAANPNYVIRFKLTEFKEPWTDLVYGPIVNDIANVEGDPVIMKSDGFPTYHFANVVDDHLMKITHVLRGVEWQVSTPKHLLMYRAFGWTPPQYAHLPLLLHTSGRKLSKRENDYHVEHLKDKGYFPEALQTYLCFMGAGFNTPQKELLNFDDQGLIDHFDLSKMNTNSVRLDKDMLKRMNKVQLLKYLRGPKRPQIINNLRCIIKEFFNERSEEVDDTCLNDEYIGKVMDWYIKSHKMIFLSDMLLEPQIPLWIKPCIDKPVIDNLVDICKNNTLEEYSAVAIDITKNLNNTSDYNYVKSQYFQAVNDNKLQIGEFMKVIRCVLCGKLQGPSVAELVCLLGKEETIDRINKFIVMLEKYK